MKTVADLVRITGKKKSIIYRDIKNGKLKKVDKYIVEDENFHRYLGKEKFTHDKPSRESKPAKYTPPPPNHKTSLAMDWEKKVNHVSDYEFERDDIFNEIENKTAKGVLWMLERFQNIPPQVIMNESEVQKNYREWMKLAQSMIKVKREIDAKKDIDKTKSSGIDAFREVFNNAVEDLAEPPKEEKENEG